MNRQMIMMMRDECSFKAGQARRVFFCRIINFREKVREKVYIVELLKFTHFVSAVVYQREDH